MPPPTQIALLLGSSIRPGSWIGRLRDEGYSCAGPYAPTEGLTALGAVYPNVVLAMSAAWDSRGLDMIRDISRRFSGPLIAISAQGRPNAAMECLDAGACDYLAEPLDENELVARIRSKVRRHVGGLTARMTIERRGLKIDLQAQKITYLEKQIDFTRMEYKLFSLLAESAGRPAPYSILLRELWGDINPHSMQYLRIYILNIRQKLTSAGVTGRLIISKPKYGYALDIGAI